MRTKQKQVELYERPEMAQARFRRLLLDSSGGRWVLGHILNKHCKMFSFCYDEDTRIRQNIGREIMLDCGLIDNKTTPQEMVSKFCNVVEPESMTLIKFIRMKLRGKK